LDWLVRAAAVIGFAGACASAMLFRPSGRFSLRPGKGAVDMQPAACLACTLVISAVAAAPRHLRPWARAQVLKNYDGNINISNFQFSEFQFSNSENYDGNIS
jgi:hypothetical protein